jgi:serine protease AprX
MTRSLQSLFASATLALMLTLAPVAAQGQSRTAEAESNVTVSVAQPNPVQATSRFTVAARRTAHVRVELCNVLGQRVQTLLDERLDAGEARTLVINAEGLPAGLYLYRVQSDRSVVTRQIVISR